jgi:predicted nucleic acid-binding protein
MSYLLDTGILLRMVDANDPQHAMAEQAVDTLIGRHEDLVITVQNIAEFWNVATRPVANNGLALPPAKVAQLYQETIEPICAVLTETDALQSEFRRLLISYQVIGKQVHDARLVAMMLTWQVDRILTLNERNFRRFELEGIVVVTPASFASSQP